MGSNLNFKNFGAGEMGNGGGGGGRPPGNFPLARQSSIYSLTFDEFQSTVGGIGKDFGSMNMDELLKNIWSAEENQIVGSSSGAGVGIVGNGNLQRQGSLTLPRTLSQKTVDEVWKDISKDYGGGKESTVGFGGFNLPHKEPTLGEVTLEEFLVRAGVVREDAQMPTKPENVGFFGELSRVMDGSTSGFGYQQGRSTAGLMGGRIVETNNHIAAIQSPNLPLNVNEVVVGSDSHQTTNQQQQQQPRILPKQANLGYGGAPMGIPSSGQMASAGMRVMNNSNSVQNCSLQQQQQQQGQGQGGGLGMVGLGANGVTVASVSPAVSSSDGLTKSNNGDTSSVSPIPYVFNGGLRGRRSVALEKVVERRQRRMIKNRESAARSRARKQAYTMELEAEVAKLKEENEELRRKQAKMLEMHKNQVMEMVNQQKQHSHRNKRRCLRRTQTGPW